MTFTTAHMSISLDGFVAGPDQGFENPLGRGGMELHRWHLPSDEPAHEVDEAWTADLLRKRGAYVMGRNMFGPVRGEWSSWGEEWRGWWGEEPPYHAPVFVLTHHEHEPIEREGGTTFHFVTGGFDQALALAREAGDGDVDISGGASAVRQAFASGELDELRLDIAPVLLGRGERIFDPDVTPGLELLETEHSPKASHVRYRVVR
jgi:dihydrofolate reductase